MDSAGGASALVGSAGGNARAKTAAIAAVRSQGGPALEVEHRTILALKKGDCGPSSGDRNGNVVGKNVSSGRPTFPPVDAVFVAILEWWKPVRDDGRKRRSCSPV